MSEIVERARNIEAPEAPRSSQIPFELKLLQDKLLTLEDLTIGLKDRLEIVLSPPEVQKEPTKNPEEKPIAILAEEIKSIRKRVNLINNCITEIFQRIEI